MSNNLQNAKLYDRIYAVVKQIPAGRVGTYGQVAAIVGPGCTARQVGYAMSALQTNEAEVPWQRVINAQGKISLRDGSGPILQQVLLEKEGVQFDADRRVNFDEVGWEGPNWQWLETHRFYPAPLLSRKKRQPPPGEQISLF